MKEILRLVVAAGIALAVAGAAVASPLVYSQSNDGQSTYGPGNVWPAASIDNEIADDFDVIGSIDRVVAGGFIWGVTPHWQGVCVRFYEFQADGTPGALQRETLRRHATKWIGIAADAIIRALRA